MQPSQIEQLFDAPPAQYTQEHFALFRAFKDALNRGEVRAAEPDSTALTGWRVTTPSTPRLARQLSCAPARWAARRRPLL